MRVFYPSCFSRTTHSTHADGEVQLADPAMDKADLAAAMRIDHGNCPGDSRTMLAAPAFGSAIGEGCESARWILLQRHGRGLAALTHG